jgi:hypothetical protein
VLDRLKKLFSPREEPVVEYDQPTTSVGANVPQAGPATAPYAPAVPVEKPPPEEPDRQP